MLVGCVTMLASHEDSAFMHAFMYTRIDYSNSIYANLTRSCTYRMKWILNAVAWLNSVCLCLAFYWVSCGRSHTGYSYCIGYSAKVHSA